MKRVRETESGTLSVRQLVDKDVCSFIRMLENSEMPRFFHAA